MKNLDDSKKILIIKLSSIGDVVMITSCIRELKKHYPNAEIDMIVEEESYPIVKNNPNLSNIFVFRRTKLFRSLFCIKKDLKEIFSLIKNLRKCTYDISFDFQGLLRSVIFLYLVPSKYKIGKNRWLFLSKNILSSSLSSINAIEGYLDLLRSIGLNPKDKKTEIFLSLEDEKFASDFLTKHKILKDDLLIIFNLGTRWQTKTWALENFIELSKMLINVFDAKIILTGSKSEQKLSETLKKQVNKNIYIATGDTTLLQLAGLIKKTKIFITGDTGPMHIAAAMGTKIIALFGPTDPQRTGPYGEQHFVIKKNLQCSPCFKKKCNLLTCMKTITPKEVFKEVEKIL
ncbi:MAG: lipopolysaccharide heptosyltransferase II [bacterium]